MFISSCNTTSVHELVCKVRAEWFEIPKVRVTFHRTQDCLALTRISSTVEVSEKSPALSVHLSCAGQSAFEIGWQDGAPVISVTYTSKFSRVYSVAIETITIMYNTSLRVSTPLFTDPCYSIKGCSFCIRGFDRFTGIMACLVTTETGRLLIAATRIW